MKLPRFTNIFIYFHQFEFNFFKWLILNGKIILKIIIYFHAFRLTPFKEELMMHLW